MNDGLGTAGYSYTHLLWLEVCQSFLPDQVYGHLINEAAQGEAYYDGANAARRFGDAD